MWAIIALILFVVIAYALANSSKPSAIEPVNKVEQNQNPVISSPTYEQSQSDTATTVGKFTITVSGLSTTKDINGATTQDQYVVTSVTFKNNDNRARDISSRMATLIDDKGTTYEAADIFDTEFLSYETINPGLTRTYKIAFETPAGISGLKLRLDDGVALAAEDTVEFTLK